MKTLSLFSSILCGLALELVAAPNLREIPPSFGPHIQLQSADFAGAKSFAARDRIVGTYYFYRYDTPSDTHILTSDRTDALSTHPS